MDFFRDSQVVQIFFFAFVFILGVYLFIGDSPVPKVNTYNYLESFNTEKSEADLIEEDGFAVTAVSVEKASSTDPIINVVVDTNFLDTCTTVKNKKYTYVDRTFIFELEKSIRSGAVCQGRKVNSTEIFPIDMGTLITGTYTVRVQEIEKSFDMTEILKEEIESAGEQNTEAQTKTDTADIFEAIVGSLSSGEGVQ